MWLFRFSFFRFLRFGSRQYCFMLEEVSNLKATILFFSFSLVFFAAFLCFINLQIKDRTDHHPTSSPYQSCQDFWFHGTWSLLRFKHLEVLSTPSSSTIILPTSNFFLKTQEGPIQLLRAFYWLGGVPKSEQIEK